MVSSLLHTNSKDLDAFNSDAIFLDLPVHGLYPDTFDGLIRSNLSNDPKTLNLISDAKKIVIPLTSSFYHFLHDQIGLILYYAQTYPEYEIILDTIVVDLNGVAGDRSVFPIVSKMLQDAGVRYTAITSANIHGININNIIIPQFDTMGKEIPQRLYKFFASIVDDPTIKPYRNVLLSRNGTDFGRDYSDKVSRNEKHFNIISNDFRVYDNHELDSFFHEHGFEVIKPETYFRNFKEQVNYMYSVKTIASISGSGLSNVCFMQPGQTVIEIASPMVTSDSPDPENVILSARIHHYFSILSFKMNHLHINIPNQTKVTGDVIDFIKSNKCLMDIFNSTKLDKKPKRLWRRKN